MRTKTVCLLLFISSLSFAAKPEFGGYLSDMPSMIWTNIPQSTLWAENLLHNRLNFSWRFAKYFKFDAAMRNRLMLGSEGLISQTEMNADKMPMDLSLNCIETKNMILNTAIDRFSFTFEKNKWQIVLGRQRINWGQTFVWNPNDIFNTYSFFDFDYPERPGCDALKAVYYNSETASTELAVSYKSHNFTAALMHHWNRKSIDFQVLGGILENNNAVLGGAVTGNVKKLNLRGEFSVFKQITKMDTTGIIAAVSFGMDYMFENSLMLQGEILYNTVANSSTNGIMSLYSASLSAKTLSICDWNVFAQASYPLTPRLKGSLSGMYFIDAKAFYSGFSFDYSLKDNLDLSAIAQYFYASKNSQLPNIQALFGFVRLKWSF
jgi:hypothetical protein